MLRRRSTFDDRHATYHRILLDAVRDQPIPDSIREPIQAVLPEAEVDAYLRTHRNPGHAVADIVNRQSNGEWCHR